MPQGSLKSAVYRSFVTCDDPKGVVECRTMRKSRTSSQKVDRRIESRRSTPKNSSDTSMEYKAEKEEMHLSKGFKEEVHSPSSFQLMEVSQGVQKLNRMIDSWTKGVRFDGQSKDIAEDLLKGALDLQESLIMLGKLQEASHYMTRLEMKQNEKSESESRRIDEVGIDRTQSSESGDQNCSKGFQKRRLSADGSSRDHIEELREVIRDSFARQNILPNPTIEEMGYLHLRDLDSASEIPTTSSNQSLMVHPCDFGSIDPALSSRALQKKEKAPNLIAKLMGLEDVPSKPLRTPLQKHLESERILNQRRAVFDIDRPRGRKPHSNADSERRTLKKILETMKFKGLLKSNAVKELKPPQSYRSKKRLIDEIPPIVLIKPLMEELQTPVLQEEEALNTKKMLRKVGRKEKLIPSKTHKEGALSSKKMHRKMEAVEAPTKTLSLEEGTKHKVVRKPEEKKVKSKEKASNKLKATGLVDQKLQKKEATDKKAHKIQNARGKPSEMENVKAKIVLKSEDQAKAASAKPRKHENRSNIINNQITRRPSAFQKSISKLTTKTTISSSTDQKKNQLKKTNPVREPIAAKSVIENFGSKEDDKRINLGSENCSPTIRTDTSLAGQLPLEEDIDASESYIEEHCSNSQSSLSDVIQLSPKPEIDDKTAEEAYNHIIHSRTDIKSFKSGTNLEALLLSSPSFLSRAEELFYLNVRNPSGISDLVVANDKLSLECANELIERKSLRDSQTSIHPLLLASVGNLRVCISIDNLVREVCKGIENLRSYSNLAGESLPVDGIYAMLERDISCNGVENAIWDFDWRHAFSVDDAEHVVNEIEKLLFDGLIEEVVFT